MSRAISSRQSGHLCFESALLVEMASKNATPCAELCHLQNLSGLSGLEFSPQKGHPYLNYVPDSQGRDIQCIHALRDKQRSSTAGHLLHLELPEYYPAPGPLHLLLSLPEVSFLCVSTQMNPRPSSNNSASWDHQKPFSLVLFLHCRL